MIAGQGGWPGVNIGAQGARERQMLGTQKEDAANGGQDWASDRVAAPTVSDDLAAFTVFLVVKRKGEAGLDDGLGPVENLDRKRFDTSRGGVSVGIGRIQGG